VRDLRNYKTPLPYQELARTDERNNGKEQINTTKIKNPLVESYKHTVTEFRPGQEKEESQCRINNQSASESSSQASHEPWRNWSTCWTSLGISTPPLSLNNPLLLPGNMSGIFDKGSAGEARLSSASIDDDFDLAGFDAVDFLSSLEKDTPLDLDVFPIMGEDLGRTLDEGPEGLMDMEVFTDLSTWLGGVPGGLDDSQLVTLDASMLDDIMVNPVIQVPAVEGVSATKRTAAAAFSDASSSASNTDHDDYTVKRPRVATADSTVETAEETPRPSTSASPAPSCSSTLDGTTKYVERRIKNNIASRRSRQTRKQKFQDMESQAELLEIANEKLQLQVTELEKLTTIMKDILVQKLAKGSSS